MACECLPNCPFFNEKMGHMPSTAEMMKRLYCIEQKRQCARYMVFKELGREAVPIDLFPTQLERAREIVRKEKFAAKE